MLDFISRFYKNNQIAIIIFIGILAATLVSFAFYMFRSPEGGFSKLSSNKGTNPDDKNSSKNQNGSDFGDALGEGGNKKDNGSNSSSGIGDKIDGQTPGGTDSTEEDPGQATTTNTLTAPQFQAIIFTSDQAQADKIPSAQTQFTASNISWLYVYVTWKNLKEQETMVVKLFDPNGDPYLPLNAVIMPNEKKEEFAGQEFDISKVSDKWVVWVRTPFGAGTASSRLPGKWTARVYLNSQSMTTHESTFTLK